MSERPWESVVVAPVDRLRSWFDRSWPEYKKMYPDAAEFVDDEFKRLVTLAVNQHAALTAVAEAAKPFAEFIARFDAMPLSKIGDEFYGIHAGTEWEASLRLSDLRKLAAALDRVNSSVSRQEG